jgi:predicted PurR-regulated permease PerM
MFSYLLSFFLGSLIAYFISVAFRYLIDFLDNHKRIVEPK